MRKFFFFVMMQMVILLAAAQNYNYNQKVLKEYAEQLDFVYGSSTTNDFKMAASYNGKNLVISINYNEKMARAFMEDGLFQTSVKLMFVNYFGMNVDANDILPLLTIMELEKCNFEYRFKFPKISKTFVASPSEMMNILTLNFKETEKQEFVNWLAKYMEYGGEAENFIVRSYYNERTKTIEAEYTNEEWSDLVISLFKYSIDDNALRQNLTKSFDEMFSSKGREMMKFFYDCGVHAITIRYSNGNKSIDFQIPMQGSTEYNEKRDYKF